MVARIAFALVALVTAVPAAAQQGAAVPEGSQVTLFALGLLGVIVGRRAAINAQRRERARQDKAD